jgi:RHS repeat-associated protein
MSKNCDEYRRCSLNSEMLYNAVGRLQTRTYHLAGSGNDQALAFAYNPAGQIVTRTSSNDSYASNTALSVSRAYSVNGLNQYTATTSGGTPSATFQYDANGNLTGDGSNTYVYDAENRLVSASGGHTAMLSYDPLGRLWQVAAPSGTTRFLYDGDRLAIEYDGANNLLRAYAHGTGADEPLVWYEAVPGGTSRRYLHADHQGSIVAVADQNGDPIAINAYDEWGIPNASNLGRFGYTGQSWLPELGMWYYKARIYSPTLGRFLQTDPVGYKDQVNLYEYVGDDPVDRTDPTGKDCAVHGETTSCTYTGSRIPITFKTPPGFRSFTTHDEGAHHYDRRVLDRDGSALPSSEKGSRANALASEIAGNPTPGIDRPATEEGTPNDANPFPGAAPASPVMSYLRHDEHGRDVTVNVTMPGHPLGMGIVVRWVEVTKGGQIVVHNEGQGVGLLQSRESPGIIRNAINGVWDGLTRMLFGG